MQALSICMHIIMQLQRGIDRQTDGARFTFNELRYMLIRNSSTNEFGTANIISIRPTYSALVHLLILTLRREYIGSFLAYA